MKAFDSAQRADIWHELKALGVPECLIRTFANMYDQEEIKLKISEVLPTAFHSEKGVKQGAVSSPTLFNLITDKLLRRLDEQNITLAVEFYDAFGNTHMLHAGQLGYADDIGAITPFEFLEQTIQVIEQFQSGDRTSDCQ